VLEQLESSEFSFLIRSELWGWPLALTIHALGTALLVGFILIICLRLIGLFEQIPYTSLSRFFPVVWLALLLQIASGGVLWATKPTRYVADGAFMLKLALIVIGIILTMYFQSTIRRQAGTWQMKGTISSPMARFVAFTLILWCSVVVAGRLVGYLGSLPIG
jgi:hypothetical protein